jgi:hypothetical protein
MLIIASMFSIFTSEPPPTPVVFHEADWIEESGYDGGYWLFAMDADKTGNAGSLPGSSGSPRTGKFSHIRLKSE